MQNYSSLTATGLILKFRSLEKGARYGDYDVKKGARYGDYDVTVVRVATKTP